MSLILDLQSEVIRMLLGDIKSMLPKDWCAMNLSQDKYKLVEVPPQSSEYLHIRQQIFSSDNSCKSSIFKLQNPLLYMKFRLKAHEFAQRGFFEIKTLFHDTSRHNEKCIVNFNFDWKYGERFMYGPGVPFYLTPYDARKYSPKNNGEPRTMFLAHVLVQKVQVADGRIFLPDFGYDTVLCDGGVTYVKYLDCEYYPQYLIRYET